MFRIKQFRSALGTQREMTPAGYLQRLIPGEEEAIRIIENYVQKHDLHGYSGEQRSWWCRNKDDKYNLVPVIEGEGGPET